MTTKIIPKREYTTDGIQETILLESQDSNGNTTIGIDVGGGASVTVQASISPSNTDSPLWYNILNLAGVTANTLAVLANTPIRSLRVVTSGVVDTVTLEVAREVV